MDAASFKQQFLPCHAKLYRVAFRLMGNVQDAEDMVQEAYLKLWKKRDELPEVASIEAYCVTLIKNLCYDSLRSCRPDEDSRLPEELNLPTDSNMVHEIEQKDEANQVKKLIGQLPRQHQQLNWRINKQQINISYNANWKWEYHSCDHAILNNGFVCRSIGNKL